MIIADDLFKLQGQVFFVLGRAAGLFVLRAINTWHSFHMSCSVESFVAVLVLGL